MVTSSGEAGCDRQAAKEMVARRPNPILTLVNRLDGPGFTGLYWPMRGPAGIMSGFGLVDSGRKSQMADISITQQHQLSQVAARAAAQKVADKLAGEYGLQCRWDGDVLRFERSGVEGTLALGESQAALRIRLGMLMGAFRSTIEAKVAESMRKTCI
jgi:putative polyhydroxyalkanoate system protein